MVEHINSWWCPYVSTVKCCTGVRELTIWLKLSFKEKGKWKLELNASFYNMILIWTSFWPCCSSVLSRHLTQVLESLLQGRRIPPQKHTGDSIATQIYEFYIPLRRYMATVEQGHDKRCWSISEWKTIWEVFKGFPPPLLSGWMQYLHGIDCPGQ